VGVELSNCLRAIVTARLHEGDESRDRTSITGKGALDQGIDRVDRAHGHESSVGA
jgi:hypothetical protein